jgi:TRAP-type C4-dicarboxylate transport system permease small subunit
MKAWDRAFEKFSDLCGAALLIAIVVIITLQIFARSVLGEAFIWPEELSVFLSIYLVFMGAAYNARHDSHIKVSFFANRMPRLMRFGVTFITHLLVLGHLGVLLWSMVPLSEALSISRSPAMEIPMLIVFAAIPLSAALMLVFYTVITVGLVRDWRAGTDIVRPESGDSAA